MPQNSLQSSEKGSKLLKFLQALSTFLLGYLFFESFIEKLLKSSIDLSVKLLHHKPQQSPLTTLSEDANANSTDQLSFLETIKCDARRRVFIDDDASPHTEMFLVIEIASGVVLTLLVVSCLVSVWKKSSKLISINGFILSFYCLITSVYSSIISTFQFRFGVKSTEKYYIILNGLAFVLIQVACSSSLFLIAKKIKLLKK